MHVWESKPIKQQFINEMPEFYGELYPKIRLITDNRCEMIIKCQKSLIFELMKKRWFLKCISVIFILEFNLYNTVVNVFHIWYYIKHLEHLVFTSKRRYYRTTVMVENDKLFWS